MTTRKLKAAELSRAKDLANKIRDYWTAPERRDKFEYPSIYVVPVKYNNVVMYYELTSNIKNGYPPRKYGAS